VIRIWLGRRSTGVQKVTIDELAISDVLIITPKRYSDDRGWFAETFSQKAFKEAGIDLDFVQDNHSMSLRMGTLRGFHFQRPPHAQAKLVCCTRGRILDVAVDLRIGSPTYARHVSVELTPENGRQMLIPVGFAHAFLTLEPNTEVTYKVTDIYAPDCDAGICWNDPTIAFPWKMEQGPYLSLKDSGLPQLVDVQSPFVYQAP
jgi:dTDP-4-dehydrorhamnose 3,5-epimerase